jgi:hypothetical protein
MTIEHYTVQVTWRSLVDRDRGALSNYNFRFGFKFEKTRVKILNRSSKSAPASKTKLLTNEGNRMFTKVEYCKRRKISLLSIDYCLILQKSMCKFLVKISSKMSVGRIQTKNGTFLRTKCLLALFHITVDEKLLNLVTDLVKSLNKPVRSKTKTFQGSKF